MTIITNTAGQMNKWFTYLYLSTVAQNTHEMIASSFYLLVATVSWSEMKVKS